MDYPIVVELFIGVLFAFIAFYFFSRAHGDHRTYDRRGGDSYYEREGYSFEGGVDISKKVKKTKATNTKTKKATKAQTAIIVGSAHLLLS